MNNASMTTKMKERLVKANQIYLGKSVGFSADQVRLPGGGVTVREYLNHPGAVAIVAFSSKPPSPAKILMVRQYRYPVKSVTWEIPAGKIDLEEPPISCVRRELEEETGFRAGRVKHLLSYWPTAAFSDEIIHIFGAWDLHQGVFNPDDDEFITSQSISLDQALRWIKMGKIKDSKTIIALLYVHAFLDPSSPRKRGSKKLSF